MAAGIVVREAGPEVCASLAEVEADAFDIPWSAEALRTLLDDGLTRVWVARRDARIVGGALLRVVAGEGELLRIAVRRDARQSGIGHALLAVLLAAAAECCPHGVHLEVRASNVAARHLYARHGLVDHGRRRNYYRAPTEDAILMHWRPAGHLDERV